MTNLRGVGVMLAGATLLGCQAPGVNLDSVQPHAVDVAVRRAQLDTMCASVTPTVLDRQQETPSRATGGNVMLVYAVDVAGCNQRRTYRVECPAVGGRVFPVGDPRGVSVTPARAVSLGRTRFEGLFRPIRSTASAAPALSRTPRRTAD
jgi:hypothetical protein